MPKETRTHRTLLSPTMGTSDLHSSPTARCSTTTGRAQIAKEEIIQRPVLVWRTTLCVGRGSRGSGGRLTGSLNLSNVRLLRTCLPPNSPIWTSLTALTARRSTTCSFSSPAGAQIRSLLSTRDALEHRLPLPCFETSETRLQSLSWNQNALTSRVSSPCAGRQCTPQIQL